ncbi:type VI secretion system Vgr family protein [Collimonas antrihumi]|uniref:type VI secretion system Vgr family protein n=1 Tax=Collimonas antrihumi TaxID=1940615 RepID=UPI001B8AB902|nr:type VI secretion system tip protein VgrG [Collimonas antrihumi]
MTTVTDKFSHSRTLGINGPAIPEMGGAPAFVATRIAGHERLDSLFEYKVTIKSDALFFHPANEMADADFLGKEATVSIQLEGSGRFVAGQPGLSGMGNIGAGYREISGIVSAVQRLRSENRHVYFELTLRPWLDMANRISDCRVFQNMTVIDVIDTVLKDYGYPLEKRLIDDYPPRDTITQINETDYAFISRLLQTWGIAFHFEHSENKHRMVISDSMAAYRANPSAAYQNVRFHSTQSKIDEEFIHTFSPVQKLTSGSYSTTDYQYTSPRADLRSSVSDPRATALNDGEIYEWHHASSAAAHFSQPNAGTGNSNDAKTEGQFLARIRMEEIRCHGHRAHGKGALRGMVTGHIFTLIGYPQEAANVDYLILGATLAIEEIAQETQTPGVGQNYRVDVDFMVQPLRGGQYRPAYVTPVPKMAGLEYALVVGPDNTDDNTGIRDKANPDIWTDKYGRIKIQFPWDRIGKRNQNSSCWVRVATPWAGNQLGSVFIPRVGQEVLIAFVSGNPDLPVCSSSVHNQNNLSPWQLPSQQALSGIRSREATPDGGNAAGGRSNHLIFDDTEAKIQAQLKSDHQHSQLSLGYITRIEDNQGRKDERGQGFELRSDGHGSIRSGKGMLISTEARDKARNPILDMDETVQRLTQASDQHESLASLAQQNQAQEPDGDQNDVVKVIKAQNDAIKGKGDGSGETGFPELAEPHLVLASPAGIETSTPQSTHMASGEHIALTSGQHLSFSVGRRLMASAKNGIRLFCYNAGMKLIAAAGDIDIKALKDSINVLAKLNITHTASRITITAKEEVLINGGGSYTSWQAKGVETGTNGNWAVHSASKNLTGPANLSTPTLPDPVRGPEQMVFNLNTLAGLQHSTPEPYELYRDGVLIERGITDVWGRVVVKDHIRSSHYDVKLSEGSQITLPVNEENSEQQQQLSNQGLRDLGDETSGLISQVRKKASS